ncbi:major facilitator superfamily domain-containing protein [Leptodontidium sp. 2 PMI_412]|nr:major facilitator superfamily domain-containing protein [Leptodontidium sp. 2 PMI_412]
MLPSISLALDISSHRQQMITSIYTISSGCLILLWGRLADVYGRRLIYLIGSAVFAIASISIPFSPNEICFYALRALQGMSSAATVSSAVGILTSAFPIGKSRNKAFVIFSAAASLGSILGNLAGDWLGAATVSSSLLLLLVALAEANVVGWTTPWILALIVVSIVLAVLFVFWQRHLEKNSTQQPLMKVTMFKNLQFSAIFVIICCFYGSFNSFLIFATYFYQDYLGLGVLDTTLRFIPAGVTGFLVSFVVPRALSRVPGFYILIFGVLCGITSPLLFALPSVTQTTSYWAYGFPAMCLCLSVDVFWSVASLFISQQLPEEDQALGSALLQTANQVGRSLGLAIGTGVQTAVEGIGCFDLYRGFSAKAGQGQLIEKSYMATSLW